MSKEQWAREIADKVTVPNPSELTAMWYENQAAYEAALAMYDKCEGEIAKWKAAAEDADYALQAHICRHQNRPVPSRPYVVVDVVEKHLEPLRMKYNGLEIENDLRGMTIAGQQGKIKEFQADNERLQKRVSELEGLLDTANGFLVCHPDFKAKVEQALGESNE